MEYQWDWDGYLFFGIYRDVESRDVDIGISMISMGIQICVLWKITFSDWKTSMKGHFQELMFNYHFF